MNEIVKINASDYGLEESKAQEIEAMFSPMLKRMKELEIEYNDILKCEINADTCQRAHDLLQLYVKTRTGTAEIHKKLKEYSLNYGRFIDSWKNAQGFASGEKEKTLKAIRDHFENLERERIEKFRIDREEQIKPYVDIIPFGLGLMSPEIFENTLLGFKTAYEIRIAAEKKAEEDRIAKEKADAEERERQRLENIRLKAEAEEREKQIEAEREKARKEQIKKDKALAIEREKAEAERKALEDKARKEKEEREKLEAEIQRKKDVYEKARQVEIKAQKDAEKKARLAPDKTKLLNFMQAINDLLRPEVKSIEAADIASKANIMLFQVSKFIRENADKL